MTTRWLMAVLAVMGGLLVSGLAGAIAATLLGFWDLPGASFSAAASVVVIAYLAAPRHKFLAACTVLILGAVAAWMILEPAWLPESYRGRGAYQPTHLPIIATYLGALIGLAAVLLLRRASGRNAGS